MIATVAHPGFQTAARRLSTLLLSGILLFSLSACTTPGKVIDKVTETITPSQSAEALSRQGQHASAAQAWLALAATADQEQAGQRDTYLLHASESLLLDGQLEAAGGQGLQTLGVVGRRAEGRAIPKAAAAERRRPGTAGEQSRDGRQQDREQRGLRHGGGLDTSFIRPGSLRVKKPPLPRHRGCAG